MERGEANHQNVGYQELSCFTHEGWSIEGRSYLYTGETTDPEEI